MDEGIVKISSARWCTGSGLKSGEIRMSKLSKLKEIFSEKADAIAFQIAGFSYDLGLPAIREKTKARRLDYLISTLEDDEAIKYIKGGKVDVNMPVGHLKTPPLIQSAWNENVRMVTALLNAGADVRAKNKNSYTAKDGVSDSEFASEKSKTIYKMLDVAEARHCVPRSI
jgi:hypothetical protein